MISDVRFKVRMRIRQALSEAMVATGADRATRMTDGHVNLDVPPSQEQKDNVRSMLIRALPGCLLDFKGVNLYVTLPLGYPERDRPLMTQIPRPLWPYLVEG